MKDLDIEDKLAMAYFYNLNCLSDIERQKKLSDLLSKGYTYGKLSLLFKTPKTTLHGWANPDKKKAVYDKGESIKDIKVSDPIKVSKVASGYDHANTKFSFYCWIQEGFDNIKVEAIPLTDAQKRNIDIIQLRLYKIIGMRLK